MTYMYGYLNWQTKNGNQPLTILKVSPHTNFQASIWWSPLKPDPPSLSPVNMDGHWITQHKLYTQFHCLLMCHLHHWMTSIN